MSLQDAIIRGWSITLEAGLIVADKDDRRRGVTDRYAQQVRTGTYEEGLKKVLAAIGQFEAEHAALPLGSA